MGAEKKKLVLVVDDESDVRNYLKSALEDAGFRVETAADGFDALEKVEQERPDLISLDLVMPRRSGVKLYHDLQKDRSLSKIPVLIVTGHARDELGRADFESMSMSGQGIYLEKPVSPGNYVRAVRRRLGMEPLVAEKPEADQLRVDLLKAMNGADLGSLQKALDALKKRE